MKILITGSQGYIGTVLSDYLLKKNYDIIGYDINFYNDELYKSTKDFYQIQKDLRDVDDNDFIEIDTVIFLAALSNDPLGELNPKITNEINYEATKNFISKAKEQNVKKLIYISTQSIYGISDISSELDEDNSEKNPITEYAKAKYKTEEYLRSISDENFTITILRPSTVFGKSPKFRSDIVFNNFMGCAYLNNKIEILSDGSPWRPVVHVLDLCNAIYATLVAPNSLVNNEAFNVGIKNGNYTVKDIAIAAQKAVPNSKLIFLNQHTDPRTYRVSFEKILSKLKDFYHPEWTLEKGAKEMLDFFNEINFMEEDFRGRKTNRLKQINYLIEENKINEDLEVFSNDI